MEKLFESHLKPRGADSAGLTIGALDNNLTFYGPDRVGERANAFEFQCVPGVELNRISDRGILFMDFRITTVIDSHKSRDDLHRATRVVFRADFKFEIKVNPISTSVKRLKSEFK